MSQESYIKLHQIAESRLASPRNLASRFNGKNQSPYYQPSGMGTAPYAQSGDFSAHGQKQAYDKMQELKGRLRI